MNIINILILISLIFSTQSALASENDTSHNCQLTAGYDEAKPFHYKNDSDVVVGIDADILRGVMNSIGCQITFQELPWARTLLYVETGTVDVAIGAGYKNARAQWANYSVAYKSINHWLYTRKNRHIDVDSIDEFFNKGLTLGVVTGWGYPIEIRDALSNPNYSNLIIEVSDFEQLPKMLDANRINGIIAIPDQLKSKVVRNNFSHQFISNAQYQEDLHFMFSKESVPPRFVTDFNNALYQLIHNGHRSKILRKYE